MSIYQETSQGQIRLVIVDNDGAAPDDLTIAILNDGVIAELKLCQAEAEMLRGLLDLVIRQCRY